MSGFVGETQLGPVFPELPGLEDAQRRDDAGDQLRWRHVEGRVACGAAGVGHAYGLSPSAVGNAPRAQHFVLCALLDRDGQAGLEFPVDRR